MNKTTRRISGTHKTMQVAALATLLIVGLASAAVAQGPGSGRGGRGDGEFGPQMRVERMASQLDLSDEQVAAISEIHAKGRADNLELRKQMMRLRNEKQGEMLKDEPSAGKVAELTQKIGDLRTKMSLNRSASRLAVRKLLTPEQRDKMLLMGGRGAGGGREGHRGGHGSRDGSGPQHDGAGRNW